ncbi:MAG: ATP:cob(I)alamin adenosyltransferase [Verrucomicrobiales bacterium]|nr:ATP:cob(I)alamin adenosyltransferase [Verrucomicrobiales bacterium]|tara:strand:- start:2305 stop:2835 length:531 start_codon:yes stop_codon:yes gene_type:complete
MSIATKTGDDGTTGLMYNRRLSKHHPRVEAYGTVDELNSALGLARAHSADPFITDNLLTIQKDLVIFMGELATHPDDLERFRKDGFKEVTPEMTTKLDELVAKIEAEKITYKGWATPGDNPSSAGLDVARTICRRAERRLCELREFHGLKNNEGLIYLNRLADLLWLFARWTEKDS